MDKVSAILIIGIVFFVTASMAMLHGMSEAGEGRGYDTLFFNDDTSVANNGDTELWIRAKVSEKGDKAANTEIEKHINKSCWTEGGDGWYYYSKSIGFLQVTEPFINNDEIDAKLFSEGNGSGFRLEVEAVDQAWLPAWAENGKSAFNMLRKK